MGAVGAAIEVTKAMATTVGSFIAEHGETIQRVANKTGGTVRVARTVQAANDSNYHKVIDLALDGASVVVAASVGNIPLLGAAVQGGIGAAKVGNNLIAGDMQGARSAAIEGATMAGASLIPGGGIVAKIAKAGVMGAGAFASNADSIKAAVSGGETVNTAGGMPPSMPAKTPETKLAAAKVLPGHSA